MITKLFRFYVLSSTHVALAVLSLSYLTHLQFDLSLQTDLFAFIFCATVGTYNFIRYYASPDTRSSFNTPILVFSLISALGMGLSATKLTSQTLLVALLLGTMSLTYVLPSNRFFGGLRYLPNLKSFIVAACWASVVVILPLLNHQVEFDRVAWLIWLQMALWTFSTMIPFELINSADVEFVVMDVAGKIVEKRQLGTLQSGKHNVEFRSNDLSDGIYYYSVIVDGIRSTKRMAVAK